ncbi:hypothetical protein FOA52_001487 [Chlamydomonas sp. UWO 241]|nr:hypothetical protein FOA52_001487 [Chlamydomonas sp. UWO 241]
MPTSQPEEDAKVLNFGDVCLRRSDVCLLNAPHWLNDQIITFYYEYAADEKFKDLDGLLLVAGEVSHLLSNSSAADAALVLEARSPAVHEKELVLFAVNDNTSVEKAGGSHWSLLLYCRSTSTFRHYDSLSTRGSRAAATKLYRSVGPTLGAGRECPLVHVEGMPQQENGYDCGVYVLMVTDALCTAAQAQWSKACRTRSGVGMALDLDGVERALETWLTPKAVSAFRLTLLELVAELQQRKREE